MTSAATGGADAAREARAASVNEPASLDTSDVVLVLRPRSSFSAEAMLAASDDASPMLLRLDPPNQVRLLAVDPEPIEEAEAERASAEALAPDADTSESSAGTSGSDVVLSEAGISG